MLIRQRLTQMGSVYLYSLSLCTYRFSRRWSESIDRGCHQIYSKVLVNLKHVGIQARWLLLVRIKGHKHAA